MGFIYKIENRVNGKIYIGKTSKSVETRQKQHLQAALSTNISFALYSAMRKYGVENFSVETIEESDDALLSSREKFYINYYNSFSPAGFGYNCTLGGEGNPTLDYDEIYRLQDEGLCIKEIAEQLHHDRSNIREALKIYENYSKEESQRRGHALRIKTIGKWEVSQYDSAGNYINTFVSPSAAEDSTGISEKNIQCCLSGASLTAGGFQQKYNIDDAVVEDVSSRCRNYQRPVTQFFDDNSQITYCSAAEAGRATGISASSIRKACKNNKYTAGGYRWSY